MVNADDEGHEGHVDPLEMAIVVAHEPLELMACSLRKRLEQEGEQGGDEGTFIAFWSPL